MPTNTVLVPHHSLLWEIVTIPELEKHEPNASVGRAAVPPERQFSLESAQQRRAPSVGVSAEIPGVLLFGGICHHVSHVQRM